MLLKNRDDIIIIIIIIILFVLWLFMNIDYIEIIYYKTKNVNLSNNIIKTNDILYTKKTI